MNEPSASPPGQPPPVAEDPFEPGPASLSGCGKPAVIGCLVVLVILAVGLIVLVSQSPRLMRYLMRQMQSQVVAALPEDLDDGERQRLDAAFDAAVDALMAGRVDATSMGNLQRLSAALPQRGETLSREQVAEIVSLLEAIAGVSGPDAGRGPAPAGAVAIGLSP